MSIHGICFDEGQNGNCGMECRGFLDGECDIAEEMVENCFEDLTDDDWEVFENEYGLEKEAYESLWERQVRKCQTEHTWDKSCMSVLHPRISFFSKE